MANIFDYIDTALGYADKYKDLIKIGGSAGKAYLDYKNQKELNELTEDAYKKYMQEKQAAGQEAQAAVDINLTPMEVTGIPKSKADVTDFTALAAKGGIIGLKNGGDPNAGITALRKKAPGVVKRMGFESGSNEDGVAIQEAEGETVSLGTYDGNISFPKKEDESQEMAILNGLFNDVEGKVDEETKMQYYKILIPAVYKNGEISKDVYESMIQEIMVNKAKGGIANLKNGGRPGYMMGEGPVMDETDGTVSIKEAVMKTKEPMKMANFTFSKRILDEYNANVAEGYDGSIEDYIIEFYGEEYLDPTYAKGGIANLRNGGRPGYMFGEGPVMDNKTDGTVSIEEAVMETEEPMKMASKYPYDVSKMSYNTLKKHFNSAELPGLSGSDYSDEELRLLLIDLDGAMYFDSREMAKGGIANLKNG